MSNTQGIGQKPQNQAPSNVEKQEQSRNVDRSSKRGEIGNKQEAHPQHGDRNDKQPAKKANP